MPYFVIFPLFLGYASKSQTEMEFTHIDTRFMSLLIDEWASKINKKNYFCIGQIQLHGSWK
jgi:hypothetical protein